MEPPIWRWDTLPEPVWSARTDLDVMRGWLCCAAPIVVCGDCGGGSAPGWAVGVLMPTQRPARRTSHPCAGRRGLQALSAGLGLCQVEPIRFRGHRMIPVVSSRVWRDTGSASRVGKHLEPLGGGRVSWSIASFTQGFAMSQGNMPYRVRV